MIPPKPTFRLVPTLTEIVLPPVVEVKQDLENSPALTNELSESQQMVERVLERVLPQLEAQLKESIQTAVQEHIQDIHNRIQRAMQSAARQAVQLAMDEVNRSKS